MNPLDQLIVALDFPSRAEALDAVDRLEGTVRWFKVGLELYLAEGRSIVEELRNRYFQVFLDLKLHDIPNTVAGGVRSAAAAGASLLTVHASGGPAMLEAALTAAKSASTPPRVLAVTVLTSMDKPQLQACGIETEPSEQVLKLGEMAAAAGVHGLVCSPEEIVALRSSSAQDALLVVPGIRPPAAAKDDQSRIATPYDAIRYGADMLVVGRPIIRSPHPASTAQAILDDILKAQQQ